MRKIAKLKVIPQGGGLWQVGGDLMTSEQLISVSPSPENVTTYVEYEFETFILKIEWENTDSGRKFKQWTRTKKEA